ncbi:MAG: lysophospholipid acyltransferase family protein [Acidimicrobiia bacterium]|nr:lysophospholipid acyltransferase family protein [Acidimicrobiia bacterium]
MRRRLGSWFLTLLGWTVVSSDPPPDRCVIVVAPHTSNWDFPILLAASWVLEIKAGFIGKDSLFRGPFGWMFRALGGIPIDRSASTDMVRSVISAFERSGPLALALTPEGTRRRASAWKSGFYHIALGARVPVLLAFIDYDVKRCGTGPLITLTGNMHADMGRIRGFYGEIEGRSPGLATPIRLSDEDPR